MTWTLAVGAHFTEGKKHVIPPFSYDTQTGGKNNELLRNRYQ